MLCGREGVMWWWGGGGGGGGKEKKRKGGGEGKEREGVECDVMMRMMYYTALSDWGERREGERDRWERNVKIEGDRKERGREGWRHEEK